MFRELAAAVERWGEGDRDAVPALASSLRGLGVAGTFALAAALRDRKRNVAFGLRWIRLDAPAAHKALAVDDRVELAGLLSLHRNGYVRSVGVAALLRDRDPLALRFLALRLDDIVPSLQDQARHGIVAHLERRSVHELVRILPLLDQLARRSRANASGVLREVTAFLVDPAGGWPELLRATRDVDLAVRRSAVKLAVHHVTGVRSSIDLLVRGIGDSDPAIARWVAIEVTSARIGREAQDALLPHLESHRDPMLRRRALLARARRGELEQITSAVIDTRATVRLAAREKLPGRAHAVCVAMLGDPTCTRAQRIGALGALAEVGQTDDAGLAIAFLDDPDPLVRAEAVRCIGAIAAVEHVEELRRAASSSSARVEREARRALDRLDRVRR